MSIQDWAAIGEMVGAIAVVVSLIYVGVQLRQNTLATRVITSQAFVQIHHAAITPIVQEPAFRDIYWRGLAGVSNLHGSELAAFGAFTGRPYSGVGIVLLPMESTRLRGPDVVWMEPAVF